MGKGRTIARRTFLVGSVALAGGVAFGVYTMRRPHQNPLLGDLARDEVSFNPWVKVGPTGITLVAPHTDVGQGIRSLQAALIAEEMDLDFGQFDVETGPPAAAYYNTAGSDDLLPFAADDDGLIVDTVRGLANAATKVLALQVTGGSSSVKDSFVKLRRAGAVARETLKLAAAGERGVSVTELRTARGAVHLPDGEAIPYTALAARAALLEPVQTTVLRDPVEWRLLGRAMQRLDVFGKTDGSLAFGIDLVLDGMRHASVRSNPHKGGAMNGFDASDAQAMPGVQEIVSLSNGVAVLGDTTWHAMQGAAAIRIDWGAAPYPADQEQHWQTLSASFVDEFLDRTWRDDGDAESALVDQEGSVTLEYRAPYLAHAPLEPLSAIVKVSDERADIWVAHQFPQLAQKRVAELTGLDAGQVFLHNQYAGGSFGHRLEFDNVCCATEIAMQKKGVPIKLTFSREEDFAQDYPRQPGICRATGLVRNGQVDTLDISVAAPAVLRSQFERAGLPALGPDGQLAAGLWNAPYAIPNLRVRAYAVPGLAPVSSWRSVGASINGFFLESALDELIHAAGADPLEERLRLCRHRVARKVLEEVGSLSGWGSPLGEGRGRGIALVISFGVPVAEVVEVSNTAQGIRIDRVYAVADVGRVLDPVNFESQVQGAVAWGLGHAMHCEITFADGKVQQSNYHQFDAMRMHQCPPILVRGLENADTVAGIGEPPVPPAAPALANAIFAATGKRLREMPFNKLIDFA